MPGLKAIFWDQDGVIIDTEKDGHRVSFNALFQERGYDFFWDVETYGELLKISGGKERMFHFFSQRGVILAGEPEKDTQLLLSLHKRKTALFVDMIKSRKLPLRPGVLRFMREAEAAGIRLGVCTTSNEQSAQAIARGMLAEVPFEFVLAGDVVREKKPDPEIYLLALEKAGLAPDECVVIEDSKNGLLAARAAGIPAVITANVYTEGEDFSGASMVLTSLGDPEGERGILKHADGPIDFTGVLRVKQLVDFLSDCGR